ncbi:FAD-dependent monooxygenase [Paenibacillus massiliensis]|uniref:FAD-dependent monooxygenase n=1 Tax=Paenibacillus massiliensis TaxID=225917 RepID=UPI0004B1C916|nr:FAD-dependent monooxygenase [Paenibacillus massiliensis]
MINLDYEVCIVGGGPAGALLACLLVENGISTILLEKQTSIGAAFRGELVNEEGFKVLERHGILKEMPTDAYLKLERIEYWAQQHILKTIVPQEEVGHLGIHISQTELLHAILERANRYEHFKLLTGATMIDLLQNEQGYYCGVTVRMADGELLEVHSAVVAGSDGRYSTVRKRAGIGVEKAGHGYDMLWAKIPTPSGWEPISRFALVNGHQLSLFTQTHEHVQIGWNIEERSYPALVKGSFEPFIQLFAQAFPDLNEQVSRHITSWKDFVLLQIFSASCDTWVKDGLVLFGDAAHTMTPTGAFGLNAALADADVLADELLACLRAGDVSAARLSRFEYKRRAAAEQQQERQFMMEEAFSQHFEYSEV